MATIKAIIRKVKGLPNVNELGQTIIYLQYTHDSKITLFSTGIKINPSCWNENKQSIDSSKAIKKIKANEDLIKQLEKEDNYSNANLNGEKSKILSIVRRCQLNEIPPSCDAVKKEHTSLYETKVTEVGFFELLGNFIEENRTTKAKNTIKQYVTSSNHLKNFEKFRKEKISLDKINIGFYDRYMSYLIINCNMANNTVGTQIKDLKAFLAYLKKRGHIINADLTEFKILREKPVIIYLTQEELEALHNHDFSNIPRLDRVRDLFVLQCSTGLRYSDLSRLGQEHIKENTIRITAHKTKKSIIVPLIPKASAILNKYENKLPSLSEQKVNEYIKKVCQIVGLNSKIEVPVYKGGNKEYEKFYKFQLITTHVAVKTFITHCGEKGISAKVVSEITGKTVKVILDHYYGTNEQVIQSEMLRAFGI